MNDFTPVTLKRRYARSDSRVLSMMVFIDALGWEVLKDRKFMEAELPYRRKL
jgi:hypothetical protein